MFRLIALVTFLAISVAYGAEVKESVKNGKDKDSFIHIGNSSTYYHIEQTQLKNWYGAYHACRLIGADLVTFETLSELEAVGQYIIDSKLNTERYWTSGIDLAERGNHTWFSSGEPVLESLWFKGEPNNLYNIEHCDELCYRLKANPKFRLNDLQCEFEHRYICERS